MGRERFEAFCSKIVSHVRCGNASGRGRFALNNVPKNTIQRLRFRKELSDDAKKKIKQKYDKLGEIAFER